MAKDGGTPSTVDKTTGGMLSSTEQFAEVSITATAGVTATSGKGEAVNLYGGASVAPMLAVVCTAAASVVDRSSGGSSVTIGGAGVVDMSSSSSTMSAMGSPTRTPISGSEGMPSMADISTARSETQGS